MLWNFNVIDKILWAIIKFEGGEGLNLYFQQNLISFFQEIPQCCHLNFIWNKKSIFMLFKAFFKIKSNKIIFSLLTLIFWLSV